MPKHDDDIFDNSAIVPDTEDRLARMPPPTKPTTNKTSASNKNSIVTSMQPTVLTLLWLALGILLVIAGFLHYRITQQIDANNRLQTRVEALESQLGVSISDSKKSGDTMEDKIQSMDKRLSVISNDVNKLSSTLNDKTRKTLEDHEKSLATTQATINDLKKVVAQIDKVASEGKATAERANSATTELNNTVSTLQQRITQGDPVARDASRQATMALEQNDQIQKKLDSVNKRLSEQDETLRSIDSFRRSVNMDLNKLKQDRTQNIAVPVQ